MFHILAGTTKLIRTSDVTELWQALSWKAGSTVLEDSVISSLAKQKLPSQTWAVTSKLLSECVCGGEVQRHPVLEMCRSKFSHFPFLEVLDFVLLLCMDQSYPSKAFSTAGLCPI